MRLLKLQLLLVLMLFPAYTSLRDPLTITLRARTLPRDAITLSVGYEEADDAISVSDNAGNMYTLVGSSESVFNGFVKLFAIKSPKPLKMIYIRHSGRNASGIVDVKPAKLMWDD